MLKRTIYFESGCHLSFENSQLVCKPRDQDGEIKTIPIEDIGFVVMDNHSITMSLRLIEELTANNSAIVFCDKKHHPAAMSLPFAANTTHAETVKAQLGMSKPLKKNLWRQTVKTKIVNQAMLLDKTEKPGGKTLKRFAQGVKSGDSDNREGVAARVYWKNLFGDDFKRDRNGDSPNGLLNYAYTILRAAVARALVGSGLYPAIGIHHCNKYNSYALADDIIEPYRPYADEAVYGLWNNSDETECEISKQAKQQLLRLLAADVHMTNTLRPMMVGLTYTTASLVKCIQQKKRDIDYPVMKLTNDV